LSQVERVLAETDAGALVSLLSPSYEQPRLSHAPDRRLNLSLSDIVAPLDGHVMPGEEHVAALIDFVRGWDQAKPLVIHCYAGVSRSPAAAFIALCALTSAPEADIARELRALSPSATPNPRMIALADKRLSREGRMVAAIESIGRGADCFEGDVFCLETA
jgi:predicted protein tyrosine phosphatase